MTMAAVVDSFQVRVKNALNGQYKPCMRRSLQAVALYEADRSLKHLYPQLRPFQKKHALYATAVDLLSTLDFLTENHEQEIMFRTNASKDLLTPQLAWRKMKMAAREIKQTILPKAKEVMETDASNKGKSHEEFCELLLQTMFEEKRGSGVPHPPMWEFNHNHLFTIYRVYYRGIEVDPELYSPKPNRMVTVPVKKHVNVPIPEVGASVPPALAKANGKVRGKGGQKRREMLKELEDHPAIAKANGKVRGKGGLAKQKRREMLKELQDHPAIAKANGKVRGKGGLAKQKRRAMLKEIKLHTDLLNEFEGVIPKEALLERKMALCNALLSTPPPRQWAIVARGGKQQMKKAQVAHGAPELKVIALPTKEEDWEKVADEINETAPVKEGSQM